MSQLRGHDIAAYGGAVLKRHLIFAAAVAALLLHSPVKEYLFWATKSPFYTHIPLIPLVCVYLIFRSQRFIFKEVHLALLPGGAMVCLGMVCLAGIPAMAGGVSENDKYALVSFAAVLLIIGTFIVIFGTQAFRAALFPMSFLIFMIPLPSLAEEWVIRTLQLGSAEFVSNLYSLTGIPVLRDGTLFHLPGISIEVAPECSGIRSSLALLITAVLAGHLYLKKNWSRVLLALVVIPVTMFKNAIRIVVLSLLGLYVNRGYLESSLHRDGGILFFILALMIMAPILIVLRRSERNR